MAKGLQTSRVWQVNRDIVNGAAWYYVTLEDGYKLSFTTNRLASGRHDLILKEGGYMADYTGVSSTFAGGIVVYLKTGGTATYNPGNFPSYTNLVPLPELPGPPTDPAGAQTVVVSPPTAPPTLPVRASNKYSKWAIPVGVGVVGALLVWATQGFKKLG